VSHINTTEHIVTFELQQCLCECATVLHYTYIACLVEILIYVFNN